MIQDTYIYIYIYIKVKQEDSDKKSVKDFKQGIDQITIENE